MKSVIQPKRSQDLRIFDFSQQLMLDSIVKVLKATRYRYKYSNTGTDKGLQDKLPPT